MLLIGERMSLWKNIKMKQTVQMPYRFCGVALIKAKSKAKREDKLKGYDILVPNKAHSWRFCSWYIIGTLSGQFGRIGGWL